MYKNNIPYTVLTNRHFSVGYRFVFCYWGEMVEGRFTDLVQQTQFAGAGDGFGAPLNLQFVEDFAVMPFDRVQGEEKSLADLTIRESLGNELQYFYLALAQWLDQGLGGGSRADRICLRFSASQLQIQPATYRYSPA